MKSWISSVSHIKSEYDPKGAFLLADQQSFD